MTYFLMKTLPLFLFAPVIGASLLVGAGCVSLSKLQKKEAQCAELAQQLERVQSEKDKSQTVLGSTVSDLRTRNDELVARNEELTQKVHQLSKDNELLNKARAQDVSALKGTYDDLVGSLKDEIAQGQIEISQLKDTVSVNVLDKILFNSGEAAVNEQGKKTLLKLGATLKTLTDKQIVVQGHTDNIAISKKLQETFPTNWELSAQRALNVVRYLQDVVGVAPAHLSAAAFGQHRPIAANDTPQNRQKNRRIEIVIQPLSK